MALKVGMPLEGDQASWTLVEVKPRSAVFKSAANDRSEVELETSVAPPAEGPRRRARRARARHRTARAAARRRTIRSPTPASRSSGDLSKRIEDRRRQMREDAEKLRNQNGKGQPPKSAPPKK